MFWWQKFERWGFVKECPKNGYEFRYATNDVRKGVNTRTVTDNVVILTFYISPIVTNSNPTIELYLNPLKNRYEWPPQNIIYKIRVNVIIFISVNLHRRAHTKLKWNKNSRNLRDRGLRDILFTMRTKEAKPDNGGLRWHLLILFLEII